MQEPHELKSKKKTGKGISARKLKEFRVKAKRVESTDWLMTVVYG